MDGRTEEEIAARRRRLKYRCWHRGMREVDLLLGPFADSTADQMDAEEIAAFEALLDIPDQDVLAWIIGGQPVPADKKSPLLDRLLAFHAA
jgi:antitoxin CptB